MASDSYVFLSHSSADGRAARRLAEALRSHGFKVWLDEDDLVPGDRWMERLEAAVQGASAMVVLVGRLGVQRWVDREMRQGLVRSTQEGGTFRLIPALGEGADPESLPPFLRQHHWADLRDPQNYPDGIRRLVESLRAAGGPQVVPDEYWIDHSPFRRLRAFEAEDSWLFFGRDSEVDDLLSRVARTQVLAVVGNSGSGKSSLIQAGLVPAVQRGRVQIRGSWVDNWRVAVVRPSETPFDHLAERLPKELAPALSVAERAELIGRWRERLPAGRDELRTAVAAMVPAGLHVLLVVDQFDELFTLTQSQEVRQRYIEALLAFSRPGGGFTAHLVIVLRAGFYGQCLDHQELSHCLAANLYPVSRMSAPHLRQTIESRLALAGARAENGLIDGLMADVGAEPGDLALLEGALAELWEKRDGHRTLTNRAYAEMGRLRGALGRYADGVLQGIGGPVERERARKVFLDLVQLGEGAPDTRRRVAKKDLLQLGSGGQMERLLAELATSRLIHTGSGGGEDFVEVSHEALIREWPTLRQWLAESREDLRLGRRLMESAEEWQSLHKDRDSLLRGARLIQAEEWLQSSPGASRLAREFVEASARARAEAEQKEREVRERELARQQDLRRQAEAQAAAEKKAASRSRLLNLVLGCLLVVTVGSAYFAWRKEQILEARALALRALQTLGHDQPAALNLAILSWQKAHTGETRLAVAESLPQMLLTLKGHNNRVQSAEFSPNGSRIVTASMDGTVRFWHATNGLNTGTIGSSNDPVRYVGSSKDGGRVVAIGKDKRPRVWDGATRRLVATLQGQINSANIKTMAISPDGQRVATVDHEKTVLVWSAVTGLFLTKLSGHSSAILMVEFSPDGQRIVTASEDGAARVWDAASGRSLATLRGGDGGVLVAKFSADGRRIVTAGRDAIAWVWNTGSGRLLASLQSDGNLILGAEFSPDGERLLTVTAKADGNLTGQIWDVAAGDQLATLEDEPGGTILSGDFSPDGRRIVTLSRDNVTRVWSASTGRLLVALQGHGRAVTTARFSPDSRRIVTAGEDNTARVWSLDGCGLVTTRRPSDLQGELQGRVDVSGDGERMVTNDSDAVHVWSTSRGQLMATLGAKVGAQRVVKFSADGLRVIALGVGTGEAQVWSVVGGKLLANLEGGARGMLAAESSLDGQHWLLKGLRTAQLWDAGGRRLLKPMPSDDARVSPDGRRVVTVSGDAVRLWNGDNCALVATLQDAKWKPEAAKFSPDGRSIVFNGGPVWQVWSSESGKRLADLQCAPGGCRGRPAFSPESRQIVGCQTNGAACVWDAANGQVLTWLLRANDSPAAVAEFSPGGRSIVTGGGKMARVWDAASGNSVALLQGHTASITSVAFSRDGRRVLTGSNDGTARLWNAKSGEVLAAVRGGNADVESAVLSLNAQRIITTSTDKTLRIYRLVTVDEIEHVLDQ